MTSLLGKFVLALVVFSLPLQGLMAATMVPCSSESKSGHKAVRATAVQHPAHHTDHERGKPDTSDSTCHDCGPCQVCASPALSALLITTVSMVAVFPQAQSSPELRLFFPERFQRPPRSLAA